MKPLAERFWAKVQKGEGCWVWRGAGAPSYGRIQAGGKGSALLSASRVSWELERGPIPEGQWVLHHCDNPSCVRPDHLFLGSQSDNILDCVSKGRHVAPQGERNGMARLTDDHVKSIKALLADGRGGTEVAKRFGVSPALISAIKHAYLWRHV